MMINNKTDSLCISLSDPREWVNVGQVGVCTESVQPDCTGLVPGPQVKLRSDLVLTSPGH